MNYFKFEAEERQNAYARNDAAEKEKALSSISNSVQQGLQTAATVATGIVDWKADKNTDALDEHMKSRIKDESFYYDSDGNPVTDQMELSSRFDAEIDSYINENFSGMTASKVKERYKSRYYNSRIANYTTYGINTLEKKRSEEFGSGANFINENDYSNMNVDDFYTAESTHGDCGVILGDGSKSFIDLYNEADDNRKITLMKAQSYYNLGKSLGYGDAQLKEHWEFDGVERAFTIGNGTTFYKSIALDVANGDCDFDKLELGTHEFALQFASENGLQYEDIELLEKQCLTALSQIKKETYNKHNASLDDLNQMVVDYERSGSLVTRAVFDGFVNEIRKKSNGEKSFNYNLLDWTQKNNYDEAFATNKYISLLAEQMTSNGVGTTEERKAVSDAVWNQLTKEEQAIVGRNTEKLLSADKFFTSDGDRIRSVTGQEYIDNNGQHFIQSSIKYDSNDNETKIKNAMLSDSWQAVESRIKQREDNGERITKEDVINELLAETQNNNDIDDSFLTSNDAERFLKSFNFDWEDMTIRNNIVNFALDNLDKLAGMDEAERKAYVSENYGEIPIDTFDKLFSDDALQEMTEENEIKTRDAKDYRREFTKRVTKGDTTYSRPSSSIVKAKSSADITEERSDFLKNTINDNRVLIDKAVRRYEDKGGRADNKRLAQIITDTINGELGENTVSIDEIMEFTRKNGSIYNDAVSPDFNAYVRFVGDNIDTLAGMETEEERRAFINSNSGLDGIPDNYYNMLLADDSIYKPVKDKEAETYEKVTKTSSEYIKSVGSRLTKSISDDAGLTWSQAQAENLEKEKHSGAVDLHLNFSEYYGYIYCDSNDGIAYKNQHKAAVRQSTDFRRYLNNARREEREDNIKKGSIGDPDTVWKTEDEYFEEYYNGKLDRAKNLYMNFRKSTIGVDSIEDIHKVDKANVEFDFKRINSDFAIPNEATDTTYIHNIESNENLIKTLLLTSGADTAIATMIGATSNNGVYFTKQDFTEDFYNSILSIRDGEMGAILSNLSNGSYNELIDGIKNNLGINTDKSHTDLNVSDFDKEAISTMFFNVCNNPVERAKYKLADGTIDTLGIMKSCANEYYMNFTTYNAKFAKFDPKDAKSTAKEIVKGNYQPTFIGSSFLSRIGLQDNTSNLEYNSLYYATSKNGYDGNNPMTNKEDQLYTSMAVVLKSYGFPVEYDYTKDGDAKDEQKANIDNWISRQSAFSRGTLYESAFALLNDAVTRNYIQTTVNDRNVRLTTNGNLKTEDGATLSKGANGRVIWEKNGVTYDVTDIDRYPEILNDDDSYYFGLQDLTYAYNVDKSTYNFSYDQRRALCNSFDEMTDGKFSHYKTVTQAVKGDMLEVYINPDGSQCVSRSGTAMVNGEQTEYLADITDALYQADGYQQKRFKDLRGIWGDDWALAERDVKEMFGEDYTLARGGVGQTKVFVVKDTKADRAEKLVGKYLTTKNINGFSKVNKELAGVTNNYFNSEMNEENRTLSVFVTSNDVISNYITQFGNEHKGLTLKPVIVGNEIKLQVRRI